MGWLRSLSLLSVLFAGSVVTAQQQNWNSNGYQHHHQVSNSATLWQRYSCKESNPVYDCVFCDVSITRNTPGAYFGEVEITHNSQKNLTFKNSVVRKLPETLLRSFGEVELLDLTAVQLEEIVPNAFTNGINIRELYLGFNDIRELPQGVFHNMSSLTKLALDQNSLQRLPRDIFSGTPNLTDLSFANNKLQLIDDNTFQNVNNLQHLLLNSNNLTHFDLSLIPSLIEGNVSSNLLTTLAIPVNLVVLDASHNRINTVTGSNNTKLQELFLQHNNLTNITWLHRYSELVVLNLSYNELERVTDHHFKNLCRLERLYLSNNRLVALNLNSSPIGTLKILDVRHNHLLHVERNKDQFSTLAQLYLDHNSIVTLKISPNHTLQNLTLSHNDWDCKNLEQLFQNVSESVINDSDRYCKENYKHTQNICCKESDKPYLDRLIHHIRLASVAEKLQRAEGRCSASDALSGVQNLTNFMTQHGGGALLQSCPECQAELNRLLSDVKQLEYQQLQREQHLQSMHIDVDNAMRRYRVTKVGLVRPSDNLRKLFEHLNSRRTFKEGETANRLSEANRKKHEVTSLERENKDLETLLAANRVILSKIKDDTKGRATRVKKLEAKKNNNALARQITK